MRFLVLLLFLTACASAPSVSPVSQTYVYDCEGGYRFSARAEGERLWLFLPAGTRQLLLQSNRRGLKYSGEGAQFLTNGTESELILDNQQSRVCRNDRAAALWEEAKFRGVDFRATGNTPGWYLELDPEKIIYAGNYGKQLLTFPYTRPEIDDRTAQSKYLASDDKGHRLTIVLQPGYCYDSITGDKFETRVILDLDGRKLYGCGTALH